MDTFFLFSQEYPPFVPALAVVALVVAFAIRSIRSFAEECGIPAFRWRPTSSKPALDEENFRIDSTGWRSATLSDGTLVRVSPSRDVIEIAEGPYRGEQLFTWEAAMRETLAVSKRMPDAREWNAIVHGARAVLRSHGECLPEDLRRKLRLELVGHADGWPSTLRGSGYAGFCWLRSGSSGSLFAANLESMTATKLSPRENNRGFSVRCLKG